MCAKHAPPVYSHTDFPDNTFQNLRMFGSLSKNIFLIRYTYLAHEGTYCALPQMYEKNNLMTLTVKR